MPPFRENDARWVHDITSPHLAHKARPAAARTLCGVLVGRTWEGEPPAEAKSGCGCIVTDLAERGEIRLVTSRSRMQELIP